MKAVVTYERNETYGYEVKVVNGHPIEFRRLTWSERLKRYL